MCQRCKGEQYSGVRSLFNADLQKTNEYADRKDWQVLSGNVTVYLGESTLQDKDRPLFHGCEVARETLTEDERQQLIKLGAEALRPPFEYSLF